MVQHHKLPKPYGFGTLRVALDFDSQHSTAIFWWHGAGGCPPHLLVHRVGQPPPRHRHRSWSWSNSQGSTCLCLWGSSKIFHSPCFKDKAWRNGSMLFLSPSRPSRRTPSPFWWCWRACVLHGASTGRPLEVCQSCRNPDGNPQQALNHVPRTGFYLLLRLPSLIKVYNE